MMIAGGVKNLAGVFVLGASLLVAAAPAGQSKPPGKPQLNVRASPNTGFAPFRSVLTAELVGGANDYEDYYCAKIEWDWGDDTRSQASYDCEPYEKGKSVIRRRFTQDHTFRLPGNFDVTFRLLQGSKVMAAAKATVQVRDEVR
jgi:hypothetical protein